MADDIFKKPLETPYLEPALECDFGAFAKVVESRRSVRVYTEEVIPDSVVEKCLDMALLAPNSSNLQSWDFYWVKSPEKMQKLKEYCLNQPAAKTASTLIVAVARPDDWKRGQKINTDYLAKLKNPPASMKSYYEKLVPMVYGNGPLHLLAPIKSLLFAAIGLFKVIPRGPFGRSGNRLWATKTTALACENLMLAFRAAGYDTCPMEGFDEVRVKKLLQLTYGASVTMVISAGKRAPNGVYGERLRGPKEMFVKIV
ncbi:MAG TPA: nitroreductase family protein [Pseudobdellovibrionaceae bacterium]|jgi:nitroreductase